MTSCGDDCIQVSYGTEFIIPTNKDEVVLTIKDGLPFEVFYDKYPHTYDVAFDIETAHINIISGYYEEVKRNHFLSAPLTMLEQRTESFALGITPRIEFRKVEAKK